MSGCPECAVRERLGFQVYTINDEKFGLRAWSKDMAMAEIELRPRKPQVVPDWLLDHFLKVNETTAQHLPHVDIKYPGIIAQFLGRMVLIDGSHRAQRSRNEGVPYKAYVLTLDESERCRLPGGRTYIDYDDQGMRPIILQEQFPEMSTDDLATEINAMMHNNPQAERIEFELASDSKSPDLAELLSKIEPECRKRLVLKVKQEQ